MAGGVPWTPEEDQFVRDCVEVAGMTNPQLVDAFWEQFGRARGQASIEKRRAYLRVEKPPFEPEGVHIVEDGDELCVTIKGDKACTTVAELVKRAGIGDEWETFDGVAKRYYTPMKLDDQPAIVETPYTSVRFRRKPADMFNLRPNIIKVSRPSRKQPGTGAFTSFHYGDFHIPYQDPRVQDILYQVLDDTNPDMVVDHGDTLDCEQISRYPKDPTRRVSLNVEIDMASEHLGTVHALTPNAEHWWCEGNHEERLRRLIWSLSDNRAAGEILTLPEVQNVLKWENLLGIGDLGWEVIPYPDHRVLFDRLIVCHGEVARRESGASEKAEFGKYGKSGMSGHTHRVGYYGKRDYNGQLGWWGLGCTCLIRTDYASFPNWQQGFAVVTWNDDRTEFAVERIRVFDGVAYFRGRRYEGSSELAVAA